MQREILAKIGYLKQLEGLFWLYKIQPNVHKSPTEI